MLSHFKNSRTLLIGMTFSMALALLQSLIEIDWHRESLPSIRLVQLAAR
jgi:hypothetical protein